MRNYLVDLRKQHNESQQDVANALGISLAYYEQIEKGLRQKRMDVMLMSSIAVHFAVPIVQVAMWEQTFQVEWRT